MNDDIGSYYDRKREESSKAWRAVVEHQATCRDCLALKERGARARLCRGYRQLWEKSLDAGDTGD